MDCRQNRNTEMKKGFYELQGLPRFSIGIPAIRTIGWMPDHIHYHEGRALNAMFLCFTLKKDPGENIAIINGTERRSSIPAPWVGFVAPGTVIRTIRAIRHDELFFVYAPETYAFWKAYFPPGHTGFKRTAPFDRLLDRMFECLNELHTPGAADVLDALVLQMLAEIRIQNHLAQEDREERIIREIASHLTSHFAEPTDLPALLHGRGLSQRSFYRFWNRLYAESPMQMLLSKRIFAAEHLLATTGLRIQEISDMCGFSSPAYFYQSFRKRHACSPAEYRKQFQR